MASIKATATERMNATLRALRAGGYRRDLGHAQVVYDVLAGRLWVVLDEYAWDETAHDLADLGPAWRAILSLVKAAGYAGELVIPGGRQDWGLYQSGLSVMGQRWQATGITSWTVDVPGVPFRPGITDAYLTPESAEVAAHAVRLNAAREG